jgi:hypothetical protein
VSTQDGEIGSSSFKGLAVGFRQGLTMTCREAMALFYVIMIGGNMVRARMQTN